MVMTVKPDMTKIWAATGATAVPPDAKIASGWGYEMMPFEWENWIQNRNDSMLSHINQRGIPEWDAASEYFANKSYVTGSNGLVYFCLVNSTNINPVADGGSNWVRAFPSITGGGASGTWTISVSGNAATATQFATARTINGVSFNGTANIIVEPYVERDDATNAVRYLSFVDSSTAGHQRLNMDLDLTYNPSTNTISTSIAGNSGTATKWATARSISITGDATWTTAIDGSANVTGVLTLANSGVTAGTYNNVATAVTPITFDAKGRVTATGAAVTITPAFSNVTGKPTTLTGYGITDATPSSHVGSTGASHGVVTTSVAGFMSAADKTKLDGVSATGGSALVGFQQAGAGAITTTVQGELRARLVTPQQFGAVGDNTADDSSALEAMFATGLPWEIPHTASGYKISRQLTINASGVCHGFIKPTAAVGASACFVIAPSGYSTKRFIGGLRVVGDVTVRAAGVRGIQVDAPNAVLERCSALQLDYGLVVRAYSVTLRDCHAQQCNTNLSAYARSTITEINALTIDGGQYDSAVNVALNIGDTSWPDALAAGNSHGVVINIINGVGTDGAESRIDNVSTVNIVGTYAETTNTDCLWRLGGSGDGNLRNVTMHGNFWKSAKNAVRCYSGVEGLSVGPNFLSAVTQCEVKLSTDIYGVDYTPGVPVGSFANGQPVGIAFRSLPISAVTFDNFSLRHHGLINGSQYNLVDAGIWYPGGTLKNGSFTRTNRSSTVCSFLTTPSTGIAGVAAGDVFTFTTKADCYRFNGGQRVTTSPAGATYVRSVDYDAGTMILDAAITSGAATVSHTENYLSSVTFGTSAPTSGTWKRGDICENFLPSVGAPKRWLCTADGTPGTWVSEGNL